MISGIGINNEKLPLPERTPASKSTDVPPSTSARVPPPAYSASAPTAPVDTPLPPVPYGAADELASAYASSSSAFHLTYDTGRSPTPPTGTTTPLTLPARRWHSEASSASASSSPTSTRSGSPESSTAVGSEPARRLQKEHPGQDTHAHAPGKTLKHKKSKKSKGTTKSRSGGARIARAVGTGVVAAVAPPVVIAGALAAGMLAMLYTAGKLLEGTGKVVAAGPELAAKAYRSKRGRKMRRALGAPGSASVDSVLEHEEVSRGREAELGRRVSL